MTFPRRALLAAPAVLALPRFAIAQADQRPAITIAVQKVVNSNTLDTLREQSNVGERVFYSSLWEGLIGRDWLGQLGTVPGLATDGAASPTAWSSSRSAAACASTTATR
jgi:peptide/nickel transport system substrate-binding protein